MVAVAVARLSVLLLICRLPAGQLDEPRPRWSSWSGGWRADAPLYDTAAAADDLRCRIVRQEGILTMTADDIAAHARGLLDANGFLTLGTVDLSGQPWTSPVYLAASAGLREFYLV